MKKNILFTIMMVMMLALFAIGCSNQEATDQNSNDDGTEQNDSGTNNDSGSTNDNSDSSEQPEKKRIVFGRGADSKLLDPSMVTDGESIYVTNQIYDTLVRYEQEDTNVKPALATDWKVSDDGTQWTFTLREGVKFHDGTDFTAEDVVFNFERWTTAADFGYYGYMFGSSEEDMNGIIDKVEAVDEYTVQFTLEVPNAPFLYTLAMPPFAISSPDAIEKYGEDYFKNPVGTGPFVFKEWVKDDKIVLEKNPDYFGDVAKVDEVIFRVIPDNGARFMELQAGTIDMMNGLNPQDIAQVEGDDSLQIIRRPSMNVGYMAMNTDIGGPLAIKEVRQAINLAVDKDKLITLFEGMGKAAKNPMPPSLWGYNDEIEDYGYDVEEAKRLLAEAGYGDGFTVQLDIMSNPRDYMPQPKLAAQAIQQMLSDVNITVEIVENDWDTQLELTKNGEHEMAFMGWIGDNGDPDNFLYVLLDKDNAQKGSAGNYAFYKNDEVHDLLIQAQREMDTDVRTELYMEAQEIIHEDAPWLPIVHTTPPVALNKKIKNYIPHPTGSEPFNYIDVE